MELKPRIVFSADSINYYIRAYNDFDQDLKEVREERGAFCSSISKALQHYKHCIEAKDI